MIGDYLEFVNICKYIVKNKNKQVGAAFILRRRAIRSILAKERLTMSKEIPDSVMFDLDARKVNPPLLHGEQVLIKTGALQSAIFNSANFSSIATDAKGVIQIFNVGAERMLGYTAADVMDKITPADISDPQELIVRAKALSVELDTTI